MSSENKVRKSTRQPVPNPIYLQGISQLKNEKTSRIKRNAKNNDDQNHSYEDQRNSQIYNDHSYNANQSKQPYLNCKMPDGQHIKVRFIVEAKPQQKQKQKKKEKQKQYVPPVVASKPQPKTKQSTNLLSLFKQAIQDVDGAIEKVPDQKTINKPHQEKMQTVKALPPRPKRNKPEREDMIKSIKIENRIMKIYHSQFKEIQIPVDWQDLDIEQEEDGEVQQIKQKLQNCKVLKNISILMA